MAPTLPVFSNELATQDTAFNLVIPFLPDETLLPYNAFSMLLMGMVVRLKIDPPRNEWFIPFPNQV
jgi:hypothetical protein